MPRPCKCRMIRSTPPVTFFAPADNSAFCEDALVLSIDGLEALRLADLEGMYHEDAAREMGVSRQTFGNIIDAARKTAADALVNGKSVRIEGGNVTVRDAIRRFCASCNSEVFSHSDDGGTPCHCPKCGKNLEAPSCHGGGGGHCGRKRLSRRDNP